MSRHFWQHAETLNRINQESATATEAVNPARSVAIQAGLDEVSAAARTLSEALTAVTTAEQERLGVLGTETSAACGRTYKINVLPQKRGQD